MTPVNNHNPDYLDFLDHQVRIFRDHYKVTRATMDQEAIHQMRVVVKKINAIHKLKKHIHFPATLNSAFFDIIREIYSASGYLRDVQLQHTLLYNYRKTLRFDFWELQQYINAAEDQLEDQLKEVVVHIDPSAIEEAGTKSKPALENDMAVDLENDSLRFILKKIEKIKQLLLLIDNEEFVHDLRKQVKQLFFVLQFLSQYFPENIFAGHDLKSLRLIGEKLGKWNDLTMFARRVDDFLASQKEEFSNEFPEYYILLRFIKEDKRLLLNDLDVDIYLELIHLRALIPAGTAEPITPAIESV